VVKSYPRKKSLKVNQKGVIHGVIHIIHKFYLLLSNEKSLSSSKIRFVTSDKSTISMQ